MKEPQCSPIDENVIGCGCETTHDPIYERVRKTDMGKIKVKTRPTSMVKIF